MTKRVRVSRPGADPSRDAERRIEADVKALASTDSGRKALVKLAVFIDGCCGLADLQQSSCIISLARAALVGNKPGSVCLEIKQAIKVKEGK